jgi:hypothetical protein
MLLGGEREGREQGWAVDHQPGTSVNGHSHHDHQERDLHVSKWGGSYARGQEAGKRGKQGGVGQ